MNTLPATSDTPTAPINTDVQVWGVGVGAPLLGLLVVTHRGGDVVEAYPRCDQGDAYHLESSACRSAPEDWCAAAVWYG